MNAEPPGMEVDVSVTVFAADTKIVRTKILVRIRLERKQKNKQIHRQGSRTKTISYESIQLSTVFRFVSVFSLVFFVLLCNRGRTWTSQSSRHKLFCLFAFALYKNTNEGNLCFAPMKKPFASILSDLFLFSFRLCAFGLLQLPHTDVFE